MSGLKTYCLGTSSIFCMNCQHLDNWKTFNQMPGTLKRCFQDSASRIDSGYCDDTNHSLHVPLMQNDLSK